MKYSLLLNAKSISAIRLPKDEATIVHEVMQEYSQHYLEYHKLKIHKSGIVRHIDMHLVVPKQMTVRRGQNLRYQIKTEIEKRLSHSHVIVQVEPCTSLCDSCCVTCTAENMSDLPENIV